MQFLIKRRAGLSSEPFQINVEPGTRVAILGANGAGKSSLLHEMYLFARNDPSVSWMPAHRDIYFHSEDYTVTPFEAQTTLKNAEGWDRDSGRVRSHYRDGRFRAVIQLLLSREGALNRKGMTAIRSASGKTIPKDVSALPSPIDELNRIFQAGRLSVQFGINDDGILQAIRGPSRYSISQLSDGERAALLLCASVIERRQTKVFLLDEPERHLNPAIAHPLLKALMSHDPEVSFVVGTHDTELVDALACDQVLVVRNRLPDGTYELEDVTDAELEISEGARLAIRGGRKKVMFVEGERGSLDVQLYSLLFPRWTVYPSGGWAEVASAVKGVNASRHQHWIDAVGVIDRDGRPLGECKALTAARIFPIPACSIESLLCVSDVVGPVADLKFETEGGSRDRLQNAQTDALKELYRSVDDLAAKVAAWRISRALAGLTPNARDISKGKAEPVSLVPGEFFEAAKREIALAKAEAWPLDRCLEAFPIKQSRIPELIANAVGFSSFKLYSEAVMHNIKTATITGNKITHGLLRRMTNAGLPVKALIARMG